MTGAERRRHKRARCRIPCDLIVDGTAVVGEVRDVSAGGLGVLAEAPALEQGEPVSVILRLPGARPFEISALVWHVRAVRQKAGGKPTRSWGLVLGEAAPAFAKLVEKLTAGDRPTGATRTPRAKPAHPPVSAPEAAPPPLPRLPSLQQFAIRIRQVGGPRTCRVIACGATESEAVQAALAEVGAGWALLDARPVS